MNSDGIGFAVGGASLAFDGVNLAFAGVGFAFDGVGVAAGGVGSVVAGGVGFVSGGVGFATGGVHGFSLVARCGFTFGRSGVTTTGTTGMVAPGTTVCFGRFLVGSVNTFSNRFFFFREASTLRFLLGVTFWPLVL